MCARAEAGAPRMTLWQCRQLDAREDGGAADVARASRSVVAYVTLYAGLRGWDLRAPGTFLRSVTRTAPR